MDEGVYGQDIVAPAWVAHGLDYGDRERGSSGAFGYFYNFIDYGFVEGDAEYRARHYLDEQGTAHFLHPPAQDDFALRVLVFLAMRFERLVWLDSQLGYVNIPDAVMAEVEKRMDAHMAAHSG
ncbi:hypothetical protein [Devosia lucknowensis]|nr:hypothetical protein [Devosia lucknowensis]